MQLLKLPYIVGRNVEKKIAFPCISLDGNVTKQIEREANKYDYVIVDAAGRDSREMRSAMFNANVN